MAYRQILRLIRELEQGRSRDLRMLLLRYLQRGSPGTLESPAKNLQFSTGHGHPIRIEATHAGARW